MDDILGNEHSVDNLSDDIPDMEEELRLMEAAEFANLPDMEEELQRMHEAEVANLPDMQEELQQMNEAEVANAPDMQEELQAMDNTESQCDAESDRETREFHHGEWLEAEKNDSLRMEVSVEIEPGAGLADCLWEVSGGEQVDEVDVSIEGEEECYHNGSIGLHLDIHVCMNGILIPDLPVRVRMNSPQGSSVEMRIVVNRGGDGDFANDDDDWVLVDSGSHRADEDSDWVLVDRPDRSIPPRHQ
jgi:hypothetical protein